MPACTGSRRRTARPASASRSRCCRSSRGWWERIRWRSTRSTRRWASGTRDLSGTRTDGSAHNLMRAVSGIEMALWDLAGKILDVPTSTLLGGKFRDKVRVYDHAAPRNMLDKASVRGLGGEGESASERLHLPQVRFPEQRSGDRQGARPVQSRADHQGADQRAEGIRELPRSHRLGSRSDGALPLGVRPADVDSDRRRRGIDQAGVARGSAAGRLFRFVEAACARRRRCRSAWARISRAAKGSRISS